MCRRTMQCIVMLSLFIVVWACAIKKINRGVKFTQKKRQAGKSGNQTRVRMNRAIIKLLWKDL